MNRDSVGISSDDGLLVLQLVSEALPFKEALPLRLICKTLCYTIGDRVTSVRFVPSTLDKPLPMVFRLRRPYSFMNPVLGGPGSASFS
jgi:hypothetical protein